MATRPAAEPRIRLLTIFMLNLQVVAQYERSYKADKSAVETAKEINGSS
jgi:hypothetical protein